MIKHYFSIIIISLLFVDLASAQISGRIIEAETGRAIPDANISIPGTTIGSSSARDGTFRLEWHSFPVRLRISAIGFNDQTITIFESTQTLVAQLIPVVYMSEDVMVSHNRIDLSNSRTRPIPVTRISTADADLKLTSTAVDLLRSEKGVYVQQTSPGQGSVYIRGRAGRDVLYLFNGLRLNPSFVRSGQNQYFGAIDPFSTDQINVFRGPVSVYFGSDALSGGLNIVSKSLPFSTENSWTSGFMSQYNLAGTGEKTIHADVGFQRNRFSFYLSGTARDFDYYRMSDDSASDQWFPYDTRIDVADYQYYSYSSAVRYRINNRNQLRLSSFVGFTPDAPRLDQMIMGHSRQTDPTLDAPSFAYSSNTSPLRVSAHSLSLRSSIQRKWLSTANIRLGYHQLSDFRVDVHFDSAPSLSGNNPNFTRSPFENRDESTSDQYLASFDLMATPFVSTILRAGGDANIDFVSSSRFIRNSNTQTEVARLPRYPDGSKYLQTGLFVHATQNLSPKWWVESGLRFSHIYADLALEGSGSERGFDSYSTTFGYTTGSLGLTWSPIPYLYLTSNLSTGFRAPNIADLTELGVRRSRFIQVPNPNLNPEKTVNTDVSVRWINDLVNLEVTGYRVRYEDKIESVATGEVVVVSGPGGQSRELIEMTNRNENSMLLYGIESSIDIKVGSDWRSGAVFNYTYGELEERNGEVSPVDRIPPANGLVYVRYLGVEKLTLGTQVRYAGAHVRLAPSEFEDYRISNEGTDGFWVLQVMARWKFVENAEFGVFVDNVTDKAYREHGSSLDGLGRNITFSVKYKI
jgi:outer membrane receptor protein involved in Fe transport